MANDFEKLKKEYVAGLLATNAFLVKSIEDEPFTLRSGRKSYLFLDHARVASSASAYKAFVDVIISLLEQTLDNYVLCNVDSKISAQLVGSVAYNINKPQIIFKSKELTAIERGTQTQLTGDPTWNSRVAILDDVMTGGDGTAKNVADLVKQNFLDIRDIHIFVGFTRAVKESTYPTHHVLTRDELLAIVWNTLSNNQKKAVDRERASL